jgi:hypothetical protein
MADKFTRKPWLSQLFRLDAQISQPSGQSLGACSLGIGDPGLLLGSLFTQAQPS